MSLNNRPNKHDISTYTDDELFEILGLDSNDCTNQELESRIVGLIQKYNELKTETAKQFTQFFMDMYDRFFEEIGAESEDDGNKSVESIYTDTNKSEDDGKSDIETDNDEDDDDPTLAINDHGIINDPRLHLDKLNQNDFHVNKILAPPLNTRTPFFKEGFETKEELPELDPKMMIELKMSDAIMSKPKMSEAKMAELNMAESKMNELKMAESKMSDPKSKMSENSITVNQVAYKKDNLLNPIRIQTIKRIINIDSQYRDERYPLSTEFTFNLNEPLREAVAIRLYSITIPYTWYTILNTYGGNFFYFKGVSDGIDNGNFDYKIEIQPGTYDQQKLVDAIQTEIVNLKTTVTDVSFGNTSIVYDVPLGKATINLEYSNYYNESSYEMSFLDAFGNELSYKPNDISFVLINNKEEIKELRYTKSVQAFLGFNNSTYYPHMVISDYLPKIVNTAFVDRTASAYDVFENNKSFHIYVYQGSSGFIKNTTPIIKDITVSLPEYNGSYSRNQLTAGLNYALSNHPDLSNSYIERLDISGVNVQNYGDSRFYLKIELNRSTAPILPNLKVAVEFPNITYVSNNQANNIWLNNPNVNSCFAFPSTIIEVSDIQAETKSFQTSYRIFPNTYILFRCDAFGYEDPSGNTPFSNDSFSRFNDVRVNVYDPSHPGLYTFSELITHINNCFQTTNNAVDVFAMTNTKFFENTNTSRLEFNIDMAKTFTTKDYYVDLSGIYKFASRTPSGPRTPESNNYASIDLSNTTSVSWSESAPPRFSANTQIVFYPKSTSTNRNAEPWVIPIQFDEKRLGEMILIINDTLQGFVHNNLKPLSKCTFACELNGGTITSTFKFNISNTLQETNYKMFFYEDTSMNISGVDISGVGIWSNILFDPSYNPYPLVNIDGLTYSTLNSNDIISDYALELETDQIIRFKAVDDGVLTTEGTYDVYIDIIKATYTREQLLNHINTQFNANVLTAGSYVDVVNIDSNDYVVFHITINKAFTAKDYKIVFYDNISFVKCYFGTKSVRNTTWDSTLGWVLGFKDLTEYDLANYTNETNGIASITGDGAVVTNIFNNCFLVLDDYTQSHINDGLITLASKDTDIPLPSYATRTNITCDPVTGQKVYVNPSQSSKQNYSVTQILQSKVKKQSQYSITPFVKDIFALIPIKVPTVGNTYTEFGGTLQNQERLYFGPVTLQRMTVKLVNDKGDLLDLNGSNWTFSFICEQLYNIAST